MDELISKLNNIPNKYKPSPFWSWNNELDCEELRKQIRYMNDSGIGGFFIHARTGLKTSYMGEKWYECIDACIDEAQKLNMDVWFYDENGWPSGFVGGKMLSDEKNLCHFLIMKEEKAFSENALSCFIKKDDKYERVKSKVDTDTYYNVYDKLDYSNTDILNPAVVDVFIKETHEEYKKRYGKYFGNTVKGFFTDEPQFSRTDIPYSSIIPAEFKKAYGYDYLDYIVYLFNTDEYGFAFRHDYYKLVSKLYIEGFAKRIYNWCEENNLMLTGHTIDETTFMGQLACTMGVMPFYEFEHIPGIDWLGRVISHDMTTRQVGSVSAQLGRSQVLTETFAMTGWNANPLQLKHILDYLYLGGANFLCQHLMSYSLKGQGKKDHPPTCGYQIPWTEEYKILNDYATRLGYILANTVDISNTLIFHPIRSGFFYCNKIGEGEKVAELDSSFRKVVDSITEMGIYHHYGDESIMEHYASVENDLFKVGKMNYKYVIVPQMETISSNNLELLKKFIENGGKVYFFSIPKMVDGRKCDLSYLKSTVTLEEIKEDQNFEITNCNENVRFVRKASELGDFLFLINKSNKDKQEITIKIKAECADIIDLEKLCFYKIDYKKEGDFIVMNISILPEHSLMIELNRKPNDVLKSIIDCEKSKEITEKFEILPSKKNILTLDTPAYSIDGGKTYSKPYYLYAIMEKMLKEKFNGPLKLRHTFNLEDKCDMNILIEEEKYLDFKVNGMDVKFERNDIDIFALSANISDKIKIGENVIDYEIDFYNRDDVRHILYDADVKESLKNCLVYDTELESMYLYGNFEVESECIGEEENNAVIVKPQFNIHRSKKKKIAPLVESGYPFFSGKIKYTANVKKDNAEKIKVLGDIMAYDVYINGALAGKGVFDSEVNISGLLKEEMNTIEIVATISLRNTLGPHHLDIAEPMWVSPHSFTMCASWDDDKNKFYRPTYAFVNSGVNKIELLYK